MKWAALFLLLIGSFAGCSSDKLTDFEAARTLWNNVTQGLPTDYSFLYQLPLPKGSLDPPALVLVSVRDDVVAHVVGKIYTQDTTVYDPADFPTIPDIFDSIQMAIDEQAEPVTVQVTYDEDFGYPSTIHIQYQNTTQNDLATEISGVTLYTVFQQQLDSAIKKWDSLNTISYSYSVQVSCFCPQEYGSPKRIQVVNGAIVSIIDIESGQASDATYSTIPNMFSSIQDSLNGFYVEIAVEYDVQFGFPSELYLRPDYAIADSATAMSVWNVSLSRDFEVSGPSEAPSSSPGNVTVAPTQAPTDDSGSSQFQLGRNWWQLLFVFAALPIFTFL